MLMIIWYVRIYKFDIVIDFLIIINGSCLNFNLFFVKVCYVVYKEFIFD